MAFPQVKATNNGTDSTGTSHTVNLPSGIVAGDLLLVFFTHIDAASITFPVGWSPLWNISGGTMQGAGYYRRADGSEGASITVTTGTSNGTGHTTYRVSGHHRTINPQASTATGNSTTPNPPSYAPSWGAKDTLWIAVASHDLFNTISAYPTNYTNGIVDAGRFTASAQRELNAVSEDPGTFTVDLLDDWVAGTVAIPPAMLEGQPSPLSFGTASDDEGHWSELKGKNWFRTQNGLMVPCVI